MSENDRQPSEHDDTQPIAGAGQAPGPAAEPGRPAGPAAQPTDPGPTSAGPGGSQLGPGASPLGAGAGQPRGATPGHDEHHHRYGAGPEHTSAYDTHAWPPGPGGAPYFGSPQPEPARSPRKRGRAGLMAGVLAGALVLGGVAGFGGAATYDLVNGPEADGSTGSSQTATSVVERRDAPAAEGSVEAAANSILPSVVKINVRGIQGEGSGSGVVISSDGEILTNNHVVESALQGGSVSVAFNDGTTAVAEVVGTDPLTDLAVIKAKDVSGLEPARLGESGNLDVGEQVVAVGSPFGLEATVTSGIVSALNRPVSVSEGSAMSTTYPAIQTDAAINPGNSGGPLVNMNGEVVGINSSIRTSSSSMGQGGSIGLGFAIPLDEVLPIVDQLRNGETPTHARLGVSVSDAASDDGLLTGAGVAEVTSGSAGDAAGLQRGDVIVKVDDRVVTDASSLVATIRGHRPGDHVTLTVVRNDQRLELQATLDSDEGQPLS